MSSRQPNSQRRAFWVRSLAWMLVYASVGMNAAAAVAGDERIAPIVIQTQKSATLPELMTKLRSERLVYVGETHTAYADHLVQLDVLRGMASRPGHNADGGPDAAQNSRSP